MGKIEEGYGYQDSPTQNGVDGGEAKRQRGRRKRQGEGTEKKLKGGGSGDTDF